MSGNAKCHLLHPGVFLKHGSHGMKYTRYRVQKYKNVAHEHGFSGSVRY